MNRRTALKNLSALTLGSLVNAGEVKGSMVSTTEQPVDFEEVKELAPDVFFSKGKVEYFKSGNYQAVECNNGWIVFEDFVVLIDANFPAKAEILLREIAKTTSKPVRYVFNTHHHSDHIYGNRFWFSQGATAIAHTGVVAELRKYETGYYSNKPGRWENSSSRRTDLMAYSLLPPSMTFEEKLVIEDRHKRLELVHLGAGHTRGDAVAWLPEHKILFTGDACLNGPYNLFLDAEPGSWIRTLDKMHALGAEILVPGHGELGNHSTVKNQQRYFQVLYEWVTAQKQAGLSYGQLKDKLPELRTIIRNDEKIKTYLIPEPAVVPSFSLEAQTKKIFEEIIL
ncbi:MBL fold metallo-hydrolase [Chitinophaga sp. YIM B06452]|uniref:MBL fold metallo-hydrolase n=1 Tax=Chitinophaga sp. YIM B06452 TaxID=3082158 RepID=UPI0031FF1DFC